MANTGLNVNVFRWTLEDCSSNGISKRFDSVTLLGTDGPFKPDGKAVLVLLKRDQFKDVIAVPIDHYLLPGGTVQYMMGGNFVYTCDSRFPVDHPIAVHDRHEGNQPRV